jgi:hypothetical protein
MTGGSLSKITSVETNPEVELLLCCVRTDIDLNIANHIQALLMGDLDWEYLIGLSLQHGVMPLLYRNLNSTLPEAVPKAAFNKLRDYFNANTYRNRFLKDELLKILDLFETNQISVIPYKGPFLAATVYGDLSLRQFSDLDIMVCRQDVQTAKDLLLSQRYRPDQEHQTDWEAHLYHENGLFLVDLHWGISGKDVSRGRDACFATDLRGVWERSKPVSFAGRTVIHFSLEDMLMIRCQDAVKEYWKGGWPQLKWICDLDVLINTHKRMDWVQVLAQAKKLGNQRLLLLCLSLADDLLGTPLPEIVLQKIQADSQVSWLGEQVSKRLFRAAEDQDQFLDRRRGFIARNRFCIRLKERPQDKIPYYIRILKEYRRNVQRAVQNKNDRDLLLLPQLLSFLSYPLIFLYYLLRPFWRIGKYVMRSP